MAYKQMFFVQVFEIDEKNRITGGRSYSVLDEAEARAKAKNLSERVTGIVAFSQLVDEAAQDAEDPVLLAAYGRVPPEAQPAAA
jgi:hypothetical protein